MTLPLPIQTTIYAKTTGGAPDFDTGAPISSVIKVEYSISDRCGFESAQLTINDEMTLLDEDAALAWVDPANLMRPIRMHDPDDNVVWQGVIVGITAAISGKSFSIDLEKAANYIICHYKTGEKGEQKRSTVVQNTDAIDAYGRRTRILPLDDTSDGAVLSRIETALNEIAFPQSYEQTEASSDTLGMPTIEQKRSAEVTIYASGIYPLLDQVTFTSTSTTLTDTDVQIASLLTDYAAINPYFDPSEVDIFATDVEETEVASEDTTYKEKIEKLLAVGCNDRVRLAYGFYEDGFHVEKSARADPSLIAYREYTRTGLITDGSGTPLDPWSVRPNRMALIYDVSPASPPIGAVDGPARKYVSRVRVSVDERSIRATLEPGNDDPLDAILAHPIGNAPVETDQRTAAIVHSIASMIRPYASPTNGKVDLGGGAIRTGGGTIDTTQPPGSNPGDVGNTGGSPIDLAPLAGGGGGSIVTGGGTGVTGDLAIWTSANAVGDSGIAAPHSGLLDLNGNDLILGNDIAIDPGGALANQALIYDGAVWRPGSSIPGAIGSGTPGRITQWDGSGEALEDSTLVKESAGILTLQAEIDTHVYYASDIEFDGNNFRLTLDGNLTTDGSGALTFALDDNVAVTLLPATTGDFLRFTGTEWEPTPGAFVDGTGTAGRVAEWLDSDTLQASTLIMSGSNVLTLTASATATLTVPKTGTAALGTGTANKAAYWTDANTLAASARDLSSLVDGSGTATRVAEWADGDTIQASSLIKGGAGVLTISAASTQTLTIGGSSGGTLNLGGNLFQVIGNNIALDVTGAAVGNILRYSGLGLWEDAAPSGLLGTGTAGRITQWASGGGTLEDSTLLKTGAGVLTISASGTNTLTVNEAGTLALGGFTLDLGGNLTIPNTLTVQNGTSGNIAYYSAAGTIGDGGVVAADLLYGAEANTGTGNGTIAIWLGSQELGQASTVGFKFDGGVLYIPGTLRTTLAQEWDFGTTSGSPGTATTRLRVRVNGTDYYLHAET